MKKKLLYSLLILFGLLKPNEIYSQNLNAGDIAIIGINEDPGPNAGEDHSFTWISLTDIPANEVIYFTEQGWNKNNPDTAQGYWMNNDEGHYSWTAPSGGLPCGTIVRIYETATDNVLAVDGLGTISSILSGTAWNLSGGDQIIAYNATSARPAGTIPAFIAALHMDDSQSISIGHDPATNWSSTTYTGSSASASHVPPGLTNGLNCIALFNPTNSGYFEKDNAKFTGSLTGTSTALRAAIHTDIEDGGGWTTDDATPLNIAPSGYSPNVTCVAPCTDPTVPTITATANPVCSGSATTLNISGTLNDATEWAIYTGSCGGTLVGTTTTSSIIVTPTGPSTTYYVRGEGGCVTSGSCGTITVNISTLSSSISSQTNVSCNSGSNGAATVTATGGTAPYTYLWSNAATTATITGATAGTYTVTVTDANGCTSTASVTITEPATAVSASITSQTNVSCNGGSNGAATVAASGGTAPYTYTWGNGATTASITGFQAGNHTVTVTDANGCTDMASVTITEPTALVATAIADNNVSCNSASDGGATASGSGGTTPYTYLWSNAATTATITGATAGTYTVTVTDANGCSDMASVTITEPTAVVASAIADNNVSCNGASDGGATASGSGGTAPYTYVWSNGAATASVTGIAAGTYTIWVTDDNGCLNTTTVTITEPAAIDNNITQNAGVLTSDQAGATYQWYECPNTLLTGEMNQSFTPTAMGDYKVEITLGGCTVESACETVTVLGSENFESISNFSIYPNPTNGLLNVNADFDGQFIIANQLGQTVKTFTVSSNITNIVNVDNLADGIYFIKGTNGLKTSSKRLIIKK